MGKNYENNDNVHIYNDNVHILKCEKKKREASLTPAWIGG